MKNIDNEINKLLEIKNRVLEANLFIKQCTIDLIPISKYKYDTFASNNELREDALYYILEPEIGQYVEGYIC